MPAKTSCCFQEAVRPIHHISMVKSSGIPKIHAPAKARTKPSRSSRQPNGSFSDASDPDSAPLTAAPRSKPWHAAPFPVAEATIAAAASAAGVGGRTRQRAKVLPDAPGEQGRACRRVSGCGLADVSRSRTRRAALQGRFCAQAPLRSRLPGNGDRAVLGAGRVRLGAQRPAEEALVDPGVDSEDPAVFQHLPTARCGKRTDHPFPTGVFRPGDEGAWIGEGDLALTGGDVELLFAAYPPQAEGDGGIPFEGHQE